MGHSAGAYIAAMLSFDPQWLRRVGLNSQTDLAGFIGLAGPYDFLPIESRTLRTIFGGANRAETQPIFFITGKEAPSLLITAWRDRLVSPENSRRMAEKIHAHRGVAEERTYGAGLFARRVKDGLAQILRVDVGQSDCRDGKPFATNWPIEGVQCVCRCRLLRLPGDRGKSHWCSRPLTGLRETIVAELG
jgi:hypothetical protein